MKRFILALLISFSSLGLSAQKFFFVDAQFILENSQDYIDAKAEIDAASERWQSTIDAKYKAIDEMVRNFEAEKILLTEEMQLKRRKEIEEKEKEIRKYQKDKFGVNGELFKKREEAVKPIQDKIYKEIERIAVAGNYAVVFDRSVSSNVLYANNRYDKTEEVMRKLGIKKENE
jgi:outer membrane protein